MLASELLKLPREERSRVLREAAEAAVKEGLYAAGGPLDPAQFEAFEHELKYFEGQHLDERGEITSG